MTALVWGRPEDRRYENGVSRGVLFPPPSGAGVVWNGLISVSEIQLGATLTPYYMDGEKYFDDVASTNFQATLKTFATPQEFAPCAGELSPKSGFILTHQPRSRFGLTYRTNVGESGYKIHLIYNALASPVKNTAETITNTTTPNVLEYKIDAVPMAAGNHRPTAHYTIDSTRTTAAKLKTLEDALYGTSTTESYLPTPANLIAIFQ